MAAAAPGAADRAVAVAVAGSAAEAKLGSLYLRPLCERRRRSQSIKSPVPVHWSRRRRRRHCRSHLEPPSSGSAPAAAAPERLFVWRRRAALVYASVAIGK